MAYAILCYSGEVGRSERGWRYYRPNCPRLAQRSPTTTSITRGRLRKTLLGWSAPAVTICKRCRVLTQQVASGSIIFGGIAEGVRNDERTRDGRQHFSRFAWREAFRD